jgi:PAS domain S-box-containing protein
MSTPLNVLIVENSESDAAMVIRLLGKAGYDVHGERVETADEMQAALDKQAWDVVIADFRLPQFDAPAALALVQRTDLDIPFIVVSGTIGEESAVAMMKAGAHDYLMKNNLTRLTPAVERELREAKARRERKRAEEALRESEEKYRGLVEQSLVGIGLSRGNQVIFANLALLRIFGYDDLEEFAKIPLLDHVSPASRDQIDAKLRRAAQGEFQQANFEYDILCKDGKTKTLSAATTHVPLGGEVYTQTVFQDVTERKRAEEALHESEKRFRALVENSSEHIAMFGIDGTILYASPSTERVLGYSVGEFVGRNAFGLIHPDDLAATTAVLGALLQKPGNTAKVEYRLLHKDGSWRWMDGMGTNLLAEPSVQAIVTNARDITESKHAEQALRESEQLLQRTLYSLRDAVFILTAEKAEITDCNPAASEIFGYSRDEMLGRTTAFLHVDEAALEEFRRYLYSAVQEKGFLHHFEFRMKRKVGTIFPTEHSVMPLVDEKGDRTGWVNVVRDITERKQAEQALQESEEKYRSVVERANDGILIIQDFIVQYANQRLTEMWGGSVEEVIGTRFTDYLDPDELPKIAERYRRRMSGESVMLTYETVLRRKNGERMYVELNAGVITYQGKPADLVIVRDITERKRAEEALIAERTLLRTIIDILPALVYVKDTAGRKILANHVDLEYMGASTEAEALGKTDFDFYPEDMAARFYARDQAIIQTGQPLIDYEHSIVTADGRQRWLLTSKVPLRDDAGQVIGLVGVGRDITESKHAEQALRESETRYRLLFENAPVGILSASPQGQIVEVNPAALQIVGSPSAEVTRAISLLTFPPLVEAGFSADFQRCVEIGRPVSAERPYTSKWGKSLYIHYCLTPISGEDGQTILIQAILEDITERKWMEKALRDQVATLQTLVEIDCEITAATEPQGILNLVCRRAARLIHAPKSAIAIRTASGEIEMAASYGLRDSARARQEFTQFWQAGMKLPIAQGAPTTIALNNVPADASHMPEFTSRENIHALAIVPLFLSEEIRGALAAFDTAPRQWRADETQLLNMLANLAATALEKARLYEIARSRAERLETLNTLSRAITSTLNLDRVLATLLENVARVTDVEACSVALVEASTGDLVFQQATGQAGQVVTGMRLKPGDGIAGWAAEHQQSAIILDVASDPRFYEGVDGLTGFATRNIVCAPLIAHGNVIGVIELVNKRAGAFSQDDVQFLESVGAQAAVAVENARLFETERSARQRLETLYSLGQVINSTLDAAAILDRLTDEAMQVTHATHGSAIIALTDLGRFDRRSLRGYTPEQAERARRIFLPLDRGLNGRAYRTRQTVYLPDVQSDPDYFALIPETRSELVVPILRGGQVLANLDLQSPQPDAFRDVDWKLLSALIDQVAVALENARLFEETRRHLDEMSIVSQVALIGAVGQSFDETVSRAADGMSRLWPGSRVGFMFLDETDQALHLHPASRGVSPELVAGFRVPISQGLTGWAARERQPVRVSDVMLDPRYVVGRPGTRSEMVAPLLVGEHTIGVINVEHPWPNAYSGDDLRVLATLAGELATIFEKARLDAALEAERASLAQRVEERTAELRVANEQLRQAHEEVSRALEKEKELGELKSRFISTTSHEFRTPLSTILSSSELLEHYSATWPENRRLQHLHRIQIAVGSMVQLLDDVLIIGRADAGRLEFKPATLDVVQFCHDLVEEMQLGIGAHHVITFSHQGECAEGYMDEKLLRQILSNLLSNAIKYSRQGSAVRLELVCQEGKATFRVRDEGIGIPLEDQPRLFESFHRAGNVGSIPGTGLGLTIVKKSVDLHSGTIAVDSRVGEGTTFVVTLPSHLPAEEENT